MLSRKTMGFHVSSNNSVHNVFLQLQSFKSQNCDVYFSNAFTLETRLSTSPILIIIYFEISCSDIDMAKKPITWMTIIRVTKSTLW